MNLEYTTRQPKKCAVPGCSNLADPPRNLCAKHYAIGLREATAAICIHCGVREAQKDKVYCKQCEDEPK